MTNRRRCCVPGCVERGQSHKVLHKFPKPDKETERFDKWALAIGDNLPSLDRGHVYRRRLVCHSHFEEKYCLRFDRLSIIAVPTVNVGGIIQQLDGSHERDDPQNTNTTLVENKIPLHEGAQEDISDTFTAVYIKKEPEEEIGTENTQKDKCSDIDIKKEPQEVVEVEVFMGEEFVVQQPKAAEEVRNIQSNEIKALEPKEKCKDLTDSNNREKEKKVCSNELGANSRKKYIYYNVLSLLEPQADKPPRRTRHSNEEDIDSEESLDTLVPTKKTKIKNSDCIDDRLGKLYPTLIERLRTNTLQTTTQLPTIQHPDEYYLLSLFPQFNSIKQEYKLDAKADMINLLRKYNNLGQISAHTSDLVSHTPSSSNTDENSSQPRSKRRHSVC